MPCCIIWRRTPVIAFPFLASSTIRPAWLGLRTMGSPAIFPPCPQVYKKKSCKMYIIRFITSSFIILISLHLYIFFEISGAANYVFRFHFIWHLLWTNYEIYFTNWKYLQFLYSKALFRFWLMASFEAFGLSKQRHCCGCSMRTLHSFIHSTLEMKCKPFRANTHSCGCVIHCLNPLNFHDFQTILLVWSRTVWKSPYYILSQRWTKIQTKKILGRWYWWYVFNLL